jgi:hypothetical protein
MCSLCIDLLDLTDESGCPDAQYPEAVFELNNEELFDDVAFHRDP